MTYSTLDCLLYKILATRYYHILISRQTYHNYVYVGVKDEEEEVRREFYVKFKRRHVAKQLGNT